MASEMFDKFNSFLFVFLPEFDMAITTCSHNEVKSITTTKSLKIFDDISSLHF